MVYNKKVGKKINKIISTVMISVMLSTGMSAFYSNADEREQNEVYSYENVTVNHVDNTAQQNDSDSVGSGRMSASLFKFRGTEIKDYGKKDSSSSISVTSSKYDPRDFGYMTKIKDQKKLGICWTFAGNAALESYLKKNGYGDYSLSEEHMRWWAKGGEHNWDIDDSEGSTNETSIGYFTSWSGPKYESDIPYNGDVTQHEGAKKPANYDSAPKLNYQVLEAVNVATDKTSVKNAILKYGAVASGYYDDAKYMSSDSTSFYCDASLGQTHAITIVGWDDNYSKDNFNGVAKPSSNGAWLIKNSWGDYNKEHGYMWISYEDKTILSYTDNYSIAKVQENKGQKIYQHEYSMSSALTDRIITGANEFKFGQHEALQGVMFATDSIGAKYELYYIPEVNGTLDYNNKMFLKSGKTPFSGYITEDLNNFPLATGKGAIALRIDNTENNQKSSIGMEMNVKNYKMFKSKASLGQTYILVNGKLQDLNKMPSYAPANLVIKGITKAFDGGKVLAGSDRYDTAIKISQNGWVKSDNVFLVNGNAIADALTSTPLAKLKSAPILLTEKNNINVNVMKEIERLGAKEVTLIGGEGSISKNIEKALADKGIKVNRIAGEDRSQTSEKLAEEVLKINKDVKSVAIVNGYKGLADAISFSPVAGERTIPIVLANSSGMYKMPQELKDSSKISESYIIGGEKSVPNNISSGLVNPTRVSGDDRNDTNAKIIEKFYPGTELEYAFVSKNGFKNENMLIDGLAIGAYASSVKSPIVLANGRLSDEQKRVLGNKKIKNITQVGQGLNSMATTELLVMNSKK